MDRKAESAFRLYTVGRGSAAAAVNQQSNGKRAKNVIIRFPLDPVIVEIADITEFHTLVYSKFTYSSKNYTAINLVASDLVKLLLHQLSSFECPAYIGFG
jgi:hypothetical protein